MPKLSPPYLRNLDLRTVNDAIIEIYRALNIISESADEITFRKSETGAKELVINNKGKKYTDSTKASFTSSGVSDTFEVKDLKVTGLFSGYNVGDVSLMNIEKGLRMTGDYLTLVLSDSRGLKVDGQNIQVINASSSSTNFSMLALAGQDSIFNIYSGSGKKWLFGNDGTVGGDSDANAFKIESGSGTSFSDTSDFELEAATDLNLKLTGNASRNTHLRLVANNSATDGNDWTISNTVVSQTLTITNDKSGSIATQLQIVPHATTASGTSTFYTQLKVNTETGAGSETGKIVVLDSGVFKYRTPTQISDELGSNVHFMVHNFDMTNNSPTYIPFGGSQTDTVAGLAGTTSKDEVKFIAPVTGKLIKLMFQSHSAAGATSARLNVDGSDQTDMASDVACTSADTTYTLTLNSSGNSFTAGQAVRVKFEPANTPDEVAMTSVWEFAKV